MNTMKIVGIGLTILGVVTLFYQGMTFVTKTIPLTPVVGVVSLAIGVVMIMFSGKRKK